jgi:hypothetical protein
MRKARSAAAPSPAGEGRARWSPRCTEVGFIPVVPSVCLTSAPPTFFQSFAYGGLHGLAYARFDSTQRSEEIRTPIMCASRSTALRRLCADTRSARRRSPSDEVQTGIPGSCPSMSRASVRHLQQGQVTSCRRHQQIATHPVRSPALLPAAERKSDVGLSAQNRNIARTRPLHDLYVNG